MFYIYNSRLYLLLQAATVIKIPARHKQLLIYALHHAVSYCLPAAHPRHTHLPKHRQRAEHFYTKAKDPLLISEASDNRKSSLTLHSKNSCKQNNVKKKSKHADL